MSKELDEIVREIVLFQKLQEMAATSDMALEDQEIQEIIRQEIKEELQMKADMERCYID